jgi:hypothetical protein
LKVRQEPDLGHPTLLDWTVCGFDVVAKAPRKPGRTHEVPRDTLLSRHENRNGAWAMPERRVARREAVAEDLQDPAASVSRARLMQAAGLDSSSVLMRDDPLALFREAPVVDAPSGAVA